MGKTQSLMRRSETPPDMASLARTIYSSGSHDQAGRGIQPSEELSGRERHSEYKRGLRIPHQGELDPPQQEIRAVKGLWELSWQSGTTDMATLVRDSVE